MHGQRNVQLSDVYFAVNMYSYINHNYVCVWQYMHTPLKLALPYIRYSDRTTVSIQALRQVFIFRNKIRFCGEELSTPCPTPKLEDHPLSDVRNCLFSHIFVATLHIGGRSSIRNLRTRHAVVTGTHQYCSGDKIEKNEMGGACSAYGGEERRIQGFGEEA